MKKLVLALCLLAVSFTAQAQFEKGTTIINPSLSGLDFSYSRNDKAKFGVGAQVGTFLAEGIALMVNAGADWSKPIDEYTLGPEYVSTSIKQVFIWVADSTGTVSAGVVENIRRTGDWGSKPDTLTSFRVR